MLALLILACGKQSGNGHKPASDSNSLARTSDTAPVSTQPKYTITQKEIKEESKKPAYSVNVRYPLIERMVDKNPEERINREALDSATHEIEMFKNDVHDLASDDSSGSSEIKIKDTVTLATRELLSIVFDEYKFIAGAAHPGSLTWTMSYDLTSGKRLALADLFTPGEKYLGVISKICIDSLKKRLGSDESMADWIEKGASPQAANFVNFALHNDHLQIIFGEYQIGPHAVGAQEVSIPYTALKEVIAPQGPLRSLVK